MPTEGRGWRLHPALTQLLTVQEETDRKRTMRRRLTPSTHIFNELEVAVAKRIAARTEMMTMTTSSAGT